MTNQNLVVPDVKSRINTIIEVAVSMSNSTILPSTAVPESLVVLGGIFGKKIMKRLDDGGGKSGVKVNAWIDSMRASSPTRVKSSLPNSQNQNLSSWDVSILGF